MARAGTLRLKRPVVFMDIEATGLSPFADRIITLSLLKVRPGGKEDVLTIKVNPGIPIPEDATAVHGIRDEDVSSQQAFESFARNVSKFLTGCDIAGFNVSRFDLPMLETEMRRAGVEFSRKGRAVVDAMRIYHSREPRDLAAAVQFYCGRQLEDGHSAEVDARASFDVLQGQLRMYDDLPLDMDGLHAISNPGSPEWIDPEGRFVWSRGVAAFNFGRYRGRTLDEIVRYEPGYIEWLLDQNFSPEVLEIARDALEGKLPSQAKSG